MEDTSLTVIFSASIYQELTKHKVIVNILCIVDWWTWKADE